MRLRPLILLAAVLSFVALGGCSDSAKKPAQAGIQQSDTDCDFKGITSGDRLEGECVAKGVAITVADKANTLHGKDYDVHVENVRSNGTLVTVTLTVKNTLTTAHEFDRRSDLVWLLVDEQYFAERADVESDPATNPFRLRVADVQPGEVVTGTVTFGLPQEQVAHLSATGSNLIFVSYRDEDKGFPTGTEQLEALGYIRLWK